MIYEILHYPELESTNKKALELLESQGQEGLVVVADKQTIGRGRQGRRWVSEEGNLFVTIALKPNKPLHSLSELAFVAALAVGRSLKKVINTSEVELKYKWPNDVLLNTQKVCGILIESYSTGTNAIPEGCVVGIGVNINSYPEFTIFPANCINNFVKEPLSKDSILPLILDQFKDVYAIWKNSGFSSIKDEIAKNIYGLGRVIHAKSHHGLVSGVFEGLCDDGGVLLRNSDDQLITVRSSEVTFD